MLWPNAPVWMSGCSTRFVHAAESLTSCSVEGLRKDELASVLDEHFQKNATRLSGDAAFKEYYGRSSPAKRASGASTSAAAATSEGEIKLKKKRAAKVKEETDA